jgi:hypothetical protein
MYLRIAVETFNQILIIFIQSSSALILKQEMKFYVFLQIKRFAKTYLRCVLHHEMQHFYKWLNIFTGTKIKSSSFNSTAKCCAINLSLFCVILNMYVCANINSYIHILLILLLTQLQDKESLTYLILKFIRVRKSQLSITEIKRWICDVNLPIFISKCWSSFMPMLTCVVVLTNSIKRVIS